MGTSNLSISTGAMNVNGYRGQAWVAQITSKSVSMSGCVQDQECTRHLGACRAPTDL